MKWCSANQTLSSPACSAATALSTAPARASPSVRPGNCPASRRSPSFTAPGAGPSAAPPGSAVPQSRRLVEQLGPGRDEPLVGLGAGGVGGKDGHSVAVLEGERDTEVAFQRAADGVAGQRPQQLPAGLLVGGRHLVVDERAVRA